MATEPKQVTIIMPVGEDAGKKVKVDEDHAARIHNTFGEYRPEKVPANDAAAREIAGLKADLSDARKALADKDAEIAKLTADLEAATKPSA